MSSSQQQNQYPNLNANPNPAISAEEARRRYQLQMQRAGSADGFNWSSSFAGGYQGASSSGISITGAHSQAGTRNFGQSGSWMGSWILYIGHSSSGLPHSSSELPTQNSYDIQNSRMFSKEISRSNSGGSSEQEGFGLNSLNTGQSENDDIDNNNINNASRTISIERSNSNQQSRISTGSGYGSPSRRQSYGSSPQRRQSFGIEQDQLERRGSQQGMGNRSFDESLGLVQSQQQSQSWNTAQQLQQGSLMYSNFGNNRRQQGGQQYQQQQQQQQQKSSTYTFCCYFLFFFSLFFLISIIAGHSRHLWMNEQNYQKQQKVIYIIQRKRQLWDQIKNPRKEYGKMNPKFMKWYNEYWEKRKKKYAEKMWKESYWTQWKNAIVNALPDSQTKDIAWVNFALIGSDPNELDDDNNDKIDQELKKENPNMLVNFAGESWMRPHVDKSTGRTINHPSTDMKSEQWLRQAGKWEDHETKYGMYKLTQFYAPVKVGTGAGQVTMNITFDQGSSELWMPGAKCQQSCGTVQQHARYDRNRSTSYEKFTWAAHPSYWGITNPVPPYGWRYGTGGGAWIRGEWVLDTISFAGYTVKKVWFGDISYLPYNGYGTWGLDGILGISFEWNISSWMSKKLMRQKTILHQMYDDGLLQYPWLTFLMPTWFSGELWKGNMSIGYYDETEFVKPLKYVWLSKWQFWQFKMQDFYMLQTKAGETVHWQPKKVDLMPSRWAGSRRGAELNRTDQCIVDSGNSTINLPPSILYRVCQVAGGSNCSENQSWSPVISLWWWQNYKYKMVIVLKDMKTNQNFELFLEEKNLIYKGNPKNWSNPGPNDTVILLLQGYGFVQFGDLFLQKYFSVSDFGKLRMGFAVSTNYQKGQDLGMSVYRNIVGIKPGSPGSNRNAGSNGQWQNDGTLNSGNRDKDKKSDSWFSVMAVWWGLIFVVLVAMCCCCCCPCCKQQQNQGQQRVMPGQMPPPPQEYGRGGRPHGGSGSGSGGSSGGQGYGSAGDQAEFDEGGGKGQGKGGGGGEIQRQLTDRTAAMERDLMNDAANFVETHSERGS